MNKYIFIMISVLLLFTSVQAKSSYPSKTYFADSTSDLVNNNEVTVSARSFETKVYTLDMLYKNQATRKIYDGLLIKYSVKGVEQYIDPYSESKFGLITDLGKKNVALEIYNDNAYMDYFRKVKRDEIRGYLLKLNSYNAKYLPRFISESAQYFNNPEFYCAYADYVVEKQLGKNNTEIVNYYLLGGDFPKAAIYIDQSGAYNNKQKIHVFVKAGVYDKALTLFLKCKKIDYEYLASVCHAIYEDDMISYPAKEDIFSKLSDSEATLLLKHYTAQAQNLNGYLFAQYRFRTDIALKSDWRAKVNLTNLTEQELRMLILAGLFTDVYRVFVEKKDYDRAAFIIQNHPGGAYADSVMVFTKAAEQLSLNNSANQNSGRIVSLYERVQDWNMAGYYSCQAKDYTKAIYCYAKTNNNKELSKVHECLGDYAQAAAFQILTDSTAYQAIAGLYEKGSLYTKAIEYYEKIPVKDYAKLSELYELSGNYASAAQNLILSDSTAYKAIAELYQRGKIYKQAATFYTKAKMFDEAISCAESTEPRDNKLVADTYYAAGNTKELLNVLGYMYMENPSLAGDYYQKTGNVDIYREKLIDSGKYKEALGTYSLNEEYDSDDLDMLIELSQKAGDRTKEVKFTNAKLAILNKGIKDLSIYGLDEGIMLASNVGNNTLKQKFVTQKSKEKARISKEEKEEKIRQEIEERAINNLSGVFYVNAGYFSLEVSIAYGTYICEFRTKYETEYSSGVIIDKYMFSDDTIDDRGYMGFDKLVSWGWNSGRIVDSKSIAFKWGTSTFYLNRK